MSFTVTDANLLLGRLHPDHFLGGRMRLAVEPARAAARTLAERFGMSLEELAEGVIRVADARMEQALRVISVERGIDPRSFTLLPFGGAGPIHALSLAEALRVSRVLIPRHPGVLSALGLALADFIVDFSQTVMLEPPPGVDAVPGGPGSWADHEIFRRCAAALAPLEASGRAALAAQGFVGEGSAVLERGLDIRYRGQSFELTIMLDGMDLAGALAAFHAAHETALWLRATGRAARDRQCPAHRPRYPARSPLFRRPFQPSRLILQPR